MPNLFTQSPNFAPIGLGAKVTSRPDIAGRNLFGFLIEVVGTGSPTVGDYLEWIKVKLNGRDKLYFVPGVQNQLNYYLNSNSDVLSTAHLYIPLAREDVPGSEWGTKDIASLDIEAKIAATNPNGKTLTSIKCWMSHAPTSVPKPLGDIFVNTVIVPKTPTAGWNIVDSLPYGEVAAVTKLLLARQEITAVEVYVGDTLVFESEVGAALESLRYNRRYKVPSSPAVFPVFMDATGRPADFIPLNGRPLKVKYFWEGSPVDFYIYLEGVEVNAK